MSKAEERLGKALDKAEILLKAKMEAGIKAISDEIDTILHFHDKHKVPISEEWKRVIEEGNKVKASMEETLNES